MSAPTGRQLCDAARAQLRAAGIAEPDRDVSRLFAHALRQSLGKEVPRHHMAEYLTQPATASLVAAFNAAVTARAARQPVSQITGMRAFWKHDFHVTCDTLDPRPETETLIEAALKLRWNRLLDMGTGTGAILISLLAERPGTSGVGTDISPAALKVAQENAQRIGVAAEFHRADWYEGIEGRFDLIVSNPPYIALDEMAGLAPEVRDWEPHQALTDGGDGLSAYRAIAEGARRHLAPGGHVLVEIGAAQGHDVAGIFGGVGAETAILPDLDGRDRVVLAHFTAK